MGIFSTEFGSFGDAIRGIFDTVEARVDEETGNVMLYEPTATYETRDGGKVVCRSLFDEMGVRSSDEVAMVSQHTQQVQGQNQVIAPSEIRLRKLKKGETCHVERVYEETKQFDFTGKEKVESAEDVAYIFRQLENAAVENSFLVLVKDGKPTVIHLGVGSYVGVMAPYEQALVAYRELKPEQVYFVHNHPSGTLKASRQDQDLLNRIKRAFGEDVVQQGIIIDTTSGNYGEFESIETADMTYSVEEEMPQSEGDEVPVKVYQFSRQVFAPDWNPETAMKVVSTRSVAEFVSSHRLGEHKKMSFLVLNNNGNVVANVFLPWTKLSDIRRSKDAGDLLAGYVHQCGGVRGILYGNYDYEADDRAILAAVGGRMRQLNAPLMDALHVEHSAYESGWSGVGEPGGEYSKDGRKIAIDDRVAQREYLLSDNYVSSLTGDEFAKSDKPLTERVAEYYAEKYDGKVEREGVGIVLLDERSVKDSIAHGIGRNKAIAFAAVPEIIKDGAIIDRQEDWKGRGRASVTFAAPVMIGSKSYVGVVIAKEISHPDGSHRFYLHEVVLKENLLSEEFKTSSITGSKQGDVAKVLKEIFSAKKNDEKVNDGGVLYRDGERWKNGYTQRENGRWISNRAEDAESKGTYPRDKFMKAYGLSDGAFDMFVGLGLIDDKEWHHTTKDFKRTTYYKWADSEWMEASRKPYGISGEVDYADGEAPKGSIAERYNANKKEIDALAEEFGDREWKFRRVNEPSGYRQTYDEFVGYRRRTLADDDAYMKKYLTEEEAAEYDAAMSDADRSSEWRKYYELAKPRMEEEAKEGYAEYLREQDDFDNQLKEEAERNREYNEAHADGSKEAVVRDIFKLLGVDHSEDALSRLSPIDASDGSVMRDDLEKGVHRVTKTQVGTEEVKRVDYATGEVVTDEVPKYEWRMEGMPGTFKSEYELYQAWREYASGYLWDFADADGNVEVYGKGSMFDVLYDMRTRDRKAAEARREKWREQMKERGRKELAEAAEKLGVEVVFVEPTDEGLTERQKKAKGWYDKSTGKIYVNLSRHNDVGDIMATFLHEAVAHKGLRGLFGNDFDAFLDNVYNNAEPEIRDEIDRLAERKYDGDKRTATEEYLAGLAETTDFENVPMSFWKKVWETLLDMLRKVSGWFGRCLTDADLRYVLWRSYRNMVEAKSKAGASVIEKAEDVSMRDKLGIDKVAPEVAAEDGAKDGSLRILRTGDRYTAYGASAEAIGKAMGWKVDKKADGSKALSFPVGELDGVLSRLSDAGEKVSVYDARYSMPKKLTRRNAIAEDAAIYGSGIDEINRRFNEQLQKQIDGTLPQKHVYKLGKPSGVLLSTGFPNVPIELAASRLAEKSKVAHHQYDISELSDLVNAIQKPLAVFAYGDKKKAQNVIVEIEHEGKNYVVGIHLNQERHSAIINDIRGLYPKDNAEWLNWISQGKLLYIDKEKIQTLINQQRRTLAEVEYLDLDNVTKLVKEFENPEIIDEKDAENSIVSESDALFRDGDEAEDILSDEESKPTSDEDTAKYRIREDEPPTKTGIGYKVFVLKDGKLYPPMVANPNGEATPVGVWLDADAAPVAGVTMTGRQQVKAGGKGTQGGSGKLAYRPGWHLGEIPYALQFNRMNPETGQRELFPANFVWAEVEYANDVDYQEEAMSYGMNANGKYQHSLAGLPRLPENGAYKYRTNPDPNTDPWIITGAMKVNRILKPSEVDAMVEAAGREPQQRQAGAITDEQVEALNAKVKRTMQEDRDMMRSAVQQMGEKLHTDINIIEDVNEITHPNAEIQEQRRRAKGWYDKVTRQVYVVLPNNRDVDDAKATTAHETIAHKGLRELVGEDNYDEFLDETYQHLRDDLKKGVDAAAGRAFVDDTTKNGKRAKSYEQQRRTAVDELFGRLAEKPFEEFSEGERTLWQKIKATVRRLLDKFLGSLKLPKWFELGDNELRYILWRSKERLERGKEHPIDLARDIVKREELGLTDEARYNMGDAPETFKARQKRAVEQKGVVMPGLNYAEVKVVDVSRREDGTLHPFDETLGATDLKKQVREYARTHGDEILGDADFNGDKVNVSLSSISEMADPKSIKNSVSKEKHLGALLKIKEIISNPVDAEVHPDYTDKDENGKRVVGKANPNILIHRVYGAVNIDGETYRVKTTIKEIMGRDKGQAYTYEVTNIELLEDHKELDDSRTPRTTSNSIAVAKLLQNVEKAYDTGKKLLDESKISDESTDLYRDPDETEDIWTDGSLGLDEMITRAAVRLSDKHRGDKTMKQDAYRAIGGNLADLRKAMSLQRGFDITTAKRVADLTKVLMEGGMLDNLRQSEIKRLLAAVKNSVGHNDIEGDVQKVMDIMVDNQLKNAEDTLEKLESIKGSKVDARGVEVQGHA